MHGARRAIFVIIAAAAAVSQAAVVVTSDGTKARPHCTFDTNCTFDALTKSICAQKLCEAAGYPKGGRFESASNDMCSARYTFQGASAFWYWVADKSKYQKTRSTRDAQIVATCTASAAATAASQGAVAVESDGTKARPHCTWASTCTFDKTTKDLCAKKLCEAAGYQMGGLFHTSSNDFCQSKFTYANSASYYYYITDLSTYNLQKPNYDMKVVAFCTKSNREFARLVSDGTSTRPHCTWNSTCTWDMETKSKCANHLCKASGYLNGGKFIDATNDMCTTKWTFSPNPLHYFVADGSTFINEKVKYDAQLTADCFTNYTAPHEEGPSFFDKLMDGELDLTDEQLMMFIAGGIAVLLCTSCVGVAFACRKAKNQGSITITVNGVEERVSWYKERADDGQGGCCFSVEEVNDQEKDMVHYDISPELATRLRYMQAKAPEKTPRPPDTARTASTGLPSTERSSGAANDAEIEDEENEETLVNMEKEPDHEVMAMAKKNAMFVDGERVEYYSRTHGTWVHAQVKVLVDWEAGQPRLKYQAQILQGRCKEDFPVEYLRRPLGDGQLVEVVRSHTSGRQTLFTYTKVQHRDLDLAVRLKRVHMSEFKEIPDADWKERICIASESADTGELQLVENLPEEYFPVTVQLKELTDGQPRIAGVIAGRLPNVGTSLGYRVSFLSCKKVTRRVPSSQLWLRFPRGTKVDVHMGWEDGWLPGVVGEEASEDGLGAEPAPWSSPASKELERVQPLFRRQMTALEAASNHHTLTDSWVMVPIDFQDAEVPSQLVPSWRLCLPGCRPVAPAPPLPSPSDASDSDTDKDLEASRSEMQQENSKQVQISSTTTKKDQICQSCGLPMALFDGQSIQNIDVPVPLKTLEMWRKCCPDCIELFQNDFHRQGHSPRLAPQLPNHTPPSKWHRDMEDAMKYVGR